jgi:hypothetical protein
MVGVLSEAKSKCKIQRIMDDLRKEGTGLVVENDGFKYSSMICGSARPSLGDEMPLKVAFQYLPMLEARDCNRWVFSKLDVKDCGVNNSLPKPVGRLPRFVATPTIVLVVAADGVAIKMVLQEPYLILSNVSVFGL